MEDINALKRWMEKDFTDLRNEVDRLDQALYGDSRERNGSGLITWIRKLEGRVIMLDEKSEERINALRLTTVRQFYLILILAIIQLVLVIGIIGLAALMGTLL